MKPKKSELLTILLFCSFLVIMSMLYIFLPENSFSQTEKRYLAETPALSWNSVTSGDWGNDVETYMADHIPGRNFFVGLNAYFTLFTGRQVGEDIWVMEDRLVEAPVSSNPKAIEKNMSAINSFAASVDQPVDLMIIPSAGWAQKPESYNDHQIIESIYSAAGDSLHCVDVRSVFSGKPALFYKTDHHWNSQGAYAAYEAYMDSIGKESVDADSFQKEIVPGFRGSTYSRSALWLTAPENLELWHSGNNLTVENGESDEIHNGVFYDSRLEEADKYTVFLDGNHSIVRVQNPEAEGKLLVIRDSYSNSLGCFLAESYGEVVLVDLRYYKQPVSQLIEQEGFDNVLVCYSIGNFMTDANIIWLK